MLMDISCLTEFRKIEQVHFSDGRRLAYLTFLNESDETIIAISGRLTMMDENGHVIERRRISFKNLRVKPREAYVCNLALDTYPAFEDAHMSVESISFLMQDEWSMDPNQFINCRPPELDPGPEKNALVAVAGRDAVCFPEQRDQYWICVCGRFNKKEWNVCCRCNRLRQKVFREFNKGAVLDAYQSHIAEMRHRDVIQRQRQRWEERNKTYQDMSLQAKKERNERFERILLIGTTCVLVGSLLLWGITQLAKTQKNNPNANLTTISVPRTPTTEPEIDYLAPL